MMAQRDMKCSELVTEGSDQGCALGGESYEVVKATLETLHIMFGFLDILSATAAFAVSHVEMAINFESLASLANCCPPNDGPMTPHHCSIGTRGLFNAILRRCPVRLLDSSIIWTWR